jgi:uncharacterized membrane protein YdjX (TVP38/TMEM64 family)
MVSPIHFPRRLIAPVVLLCLIATIWASGLINYLTWAGLAREQAVLNAWVSVHKVFAPILFVLIYVASVALSLPQAGLLTLIGGLLFGSVFGGSLAVVGATVGAVLLFLIARSAFGETMARRGSSTNGSLLSKLREGLGRDGFSYLLAIRLVPLFPFWLVNLAAALCGMRMRPFVLATLLGILPTTFITASIGAGIGGVLGQGEKPDLSILFSWPILGPLLALAVVSLLPVAWRRWRERDA